MTRRAFGRRLSFLTVGLLAAYLIGNGGPALWDRDEPRYALTSLTMLETGDWAVPRLMGEVRTAKPPMVYWLQAAAMRVFGANEFAVRLPSALGATAAVLVLGLGLPRVIGRRRAIWAAFTLGTSVLVLGVAKVGVIDGIMLPLAAIIHVGLLRLQRRDSLLTVAVIWLAVGVGGLLKGPVLLGVLLTTIVAWRLLTYLADGLSKPGRNAAQVWTPRENRSPNARPEPRCGPALGPDATSLLTRLRPLRGLLLALLVVAPWLVAIHLREPAFLPTTLRHDLLARSTRGLEGHGLPPGFHLLALFVTWFPWSVLLPGVMIHAWRRRRTRPWLTLALAGAIGPWVMFELIVTKLPHYLLPIFPMLAVLTADWLARATRGREQLDRRGMVAAAAIYAAVAVALGATPWVLGATAWIASAVAIVWAGALAWAWGTSRLRTGVIVAGTGMALTAVFAYATWLPQVEMFQTSQRVAAALERVGAESAIMVDYKEPSLAWSAALRGVELREADQEQLATTTGFAVVRRGPHLARPPAVRERWTVVAADLPRGILVITAEPATTE